MLVVRLKSVTVTEIFSGISKASGSATNALSLQAFPSPGFDSIKLFCLIPTKSITDFHFSTLAKKTSSKRAQRDCPAAQNGLLSFFSGDSEIR